MPPKNKYYLEGRRAKVAALLLENKSTRQIERAIGVSHVTVLRDIEAVRAEWQDRRLTHSDTWIAEELKRLDVAMAAIWIRVQSGDDDSIRSMIALMERRAKYLGLDAKVDALPAAQMQVVILNGDYDAAPGSLAALWSGGTALLPERSGDHAVGSGEYGQESRVS